MALEVAVVGMYDCCCVRGYCAFIAAADVVAVAVDVDVTGAEELCGCDM